MKDLNQFKKQLPNDEGQKIEFNKGHFNLDSDERSLNFSKKMSAGWELGYEKYRENWELYPIQKYIGEYPIQVDIELASSCNLKCPMCYTTTDHFLEVVERKVMDWDLYLKILDEIGGKVSALRLSWRGESTLHKKFVDAIKYAKMKGIKEVSFLTNAWNLDLEFFKKVAHAGADWITVSFDGVGEEYDKIRAPLKYEETLKKLKDAQIYKQENNLSKPLIKVQGIWPAIKKNPQDFYSKMREVSDLVAFNPLIDYLGVDRIDDIIFEENFSCPQLYQRLFIASDGKVMMCNSDEYGEEVIGDAYKETVHQIWHGEKLNKIRDHHAVKGGFKKIPVCLKCFYPRKTEVSESVVVDGRRINIENYINRSQFVGKSIRIKPI